MSDWAEVPAPAPRKTSRYADTLASAVLGFDEPGFIRSMLNSSGLFGLVCGKSSSVYRRGLATYRA